MTPTNTVDAERLRALAARWRELAALPAMSEYAVGLAAAAAELDEMAARTEPQGKAERYPAGWQVQGPDGTWSDTYEAYVDIYRKQGIRVRQIWADER